MCTLISEEWLPPRMKELERHEEVSLTESYLILFP